MRKEDGCIAIGGQNYTSYSRQTGVLKLDANSNKTDNYHHMTTMARASSHNRCDLSNGNDNCITIALV